jgi:tetratricopeptide (TPR) repeat protein
VASYLTGLAPDRHGVTSDLLTPLPETIPTLAEVLTGAGYTAAAFPDSSILGSMSGLQRGFSVVDHPAELPMSAGKWIAIPKPSEELAGNYATWLESLPADAPYFAWLHFSTPAIATLFAVETAADLEKMKGKAKRRAAMEQSADRLPVALTHLDAAVGKIRETLAGGERGGSTLVLLAGTFGDTSGGETDPPGPGFSVADAAVRVPVVALGSVDDWRPAAEPVWSLDVPATIARAAGVTLEERAEGVPLQETPARDRIQFSFAWAGRDQLGITASRVAWSDGETAMQGPGAETAAGGRLSEALAARGDPRAPGVPLEIIRPWLESKEFDLKPVAESGRTIDPALARDAARALWQARRHLRLGQNYRSREIYERLVEMDPANLLGLVEHGQFYVGSGSSQAESLTRALELYPENPEAIHWYAHAIWKDALPDSAMLMEMILPHKQHDADVLYDLACIRSLDGFLDESADFLRRAIGAGYRQWDHMETDPDLRELRQTDLYSEVMQEFGR